MNGTARGGLAEGGFAINYINGQIQASSLVFSTFNGGVPNQLEIPTGTNTIVVLHTHGNNAQPVPSAGDLQSSVPNFVRSKSELYVTVPGTTNYIKLDPKACK